MWIGGSSDQGDWRWKNGDLVANPEDSKNFYLIPKPLDHLVAGKSSLDSPKDSKCLAIDNNIRIPQNLANSETSWSVDNLKQLPCSLKKPFICSGKLEDIFGS